jgi:hypothetical protein
MAVINEYKFVGLNANTDNTEKNPFGTNNPLVSETYVINLFWFHLLEHLVQQ